MSTSQRQYTRFALDVEARVRTAAGERVEAAIADLSLGGCLFEGVWVEAAGERFGVEIRLPNGNWLPLECVRVRCEDDAVAVQFTDVTLFQQDLLASVISHASRKAGIPERTDLLAAPMPVHNLIRIRSGQEVEAGIVEAA